MKEIIEQICGNFPKNFEEPKIENDPNFVFLPDSNFIPKTVFDHEGNSVIVNSFVECNHYLSNGWDYFPLLQEEYFLQNVLFNSYIFLGLSSFLILINKIKQS